jgi:hypothetical protein
MNTMDTTVTDCVPVGMLYQEVVVDMRDIVKRLHAAAANVGSASVTYEDVLQIAGVATRLRAHITDTLPLAEQCGGQPVVDSLTALGAALDTLPFVSGQLEQVLTTATCAYDLTRSLWGVVESAMSLLALPLPAILKKGPDLVESVVLWARRAAASPCAPSRDVLSSLLPDGLSLSLSYPSGRKEGRKEGRNLTFQPHKGLSDTHTIRLIT